MYNLVQITGWLQQKNEKNIFSVKEVYYTVMPLNLSQNYDGVSDPQTIAIFSTSIPAKVSCHNE